MKRRLSAAVPPGSDFLPGSMSPVRAHMASVNTVLSASSSLCSLMPLLPRAVVPAVVGAENGIKPDDRKTTVNGPYNANLTRRGQKNQLCKARRSRESDKRSELKKGCGRGAPDPCRSSVRRRDRAFRGEPAHPARGKGPPRAGDGVAFPAGSGRSSTRSRQGWAQPAPALKRHAALRAGVDHASPCRHPPRGTAPLCAIISARRRIRA